MRAVRPLDELDELRQHSAQPVAAIMQRIVAAHLAGDGDAKRAAELALADQFAHTGALASMLGSRRLLLEMDAKLGRGRRYAASSATPVIPRVPFKEAISELVRRDPRLARSAEAVAKLYSQERAFAMAHSASLKLTARVQEILVKALSTGRDRLATERAIVKTSEAMQAAKPFMLSYAANVYRTSMATAYSGGRFRMAEDPDVKKEIPAFRFDATLDSDVRPNHKAGDGFIAATDDPAWRTHAAPMGYQCFLPGTRVSARVLAASKAYYSGPAVEIKTRNGARLRVTVNHPVLCGHEWKPAGGVKEGDNLLCDLLQVEALNRGDLLFASPPSAGRAVDDQNIPACIEDVFDALRLHGGGAASARVGPLDFHGDAQGFVGEVHVVGADGYFLGDREPGGAQGFGEFFDVQSGMDTRPAIHPRSNRAAMLERVDSTAACSPCGGALSADDSSVVGTALAERPLHLLRLGLSARLDVMRTQEADEYATADPEFVRKLFRAATRSVGCQDRRGIGRSPSASRALLRHAAMCSDLGKPGAECPDFDSGFNRQRRDGLACEVAIDEVLTVRRFNFSGHVYDLQTENGWIAAESIFTSNCRCSLSLETHDGVKRAGLLLADGSIQPAAGRMPPGWFADPGFGHGRPDAIG